MSTVTKFRRKYPSLSLYLDKHRTNTVRQRMESVQLKGCFSATVSVALVTVAFGVLPTVLFKSPFFGFIGSTIGMFASVSVATHWFHRQTKALAVPRNRMETIEVKAFELAESMRKLDGDGKLYRWLDPVAGQLLEAGAYHWGRIVKSFEMAAWKDDELPGHWSALRERSLEAAHGAMAELMSLCGDCVGEPANSRERDVQVMVESFASLDVQDALQGLSRIISGDPADYTFQSEEARRVFEPAREIAERLKSLADEVESATERVRSDSASLSAGAMSAESIDLLLGEFRAVQQAEEELHQGQSG